MLDLLLISYSLFNVLFRLLSMPINIHDTHPVYSSLPNLPLPGNLVGSSGFEPPTLRLSGARSNHLSYEPVFPRAFTAFGGDEGIRTPDPLLAGQVLSQLSYTPKNLAASCSPMPSPA